MELKEIEGAKGIELVEVVNRAEHIE